MTNVTAIVVPKFEVDLDNLLVSGQTFRWIRDRDGWWISPIGCDGAILRLSRKDEKLIIESRGAEAEKLAADYFHLGISLASLCDYWDDAGEEALVTAIHAMPGLRIIRQDPVECLFSFLCSSAAPIHRIRRCVDGMCREFGRDLGEWHGVRLFAFPDIKSLSAATRGDLDRLGLGFRGRYIIEAAGALLEKGGRAWLDRMREMTHEEAKLELLTIPGVGEKVADCVCLFSLDKHSAVPIDVHIARVARRKFEECRSYQHLSAKGYATISQCFQLRYGPFAGWAQQYFFFGEIERKGLWDQDLGKHRPKQPGSNHK